MAFNLILFIHCGLCITLICLVLLQQGKGADAGATFGGSSNTVFGAGGATDLITKTTTSLAVLFMVTSILLVRAYSARTFETVAVEVDPLAGSVMEDTKTAPVEAIDDKVSEKQASEAVEAKQVPAPVEAGAKKEVENEASSASTSETTEASSKEAPVATGDEAEKAPDKK